MIDDRVVESVDTPDLKSVPFGGAGSSPASVTIRIVAPHFVAGVVLLDDCVVRAAPILKYMMGWSRCRIELYCERKGWKPEVFGSDLSTKEKRLELFNLFEVDSTLP